jgi:hypothetical protein
MARHGSLTLVVKVMAPIAEVLLQQAVDGATWNNAEQRHWIDKWRNCVDK